GCAVYGQSAAALRTDLNTPSIASPTTTVARIPIPSTSRRGGRQRRSYPDGGAAPPPGRTAPPRNAALGAGTDGPSPPHPPHRPPRPARAPPDPRGAPPTPTSRPPRQTAARRRWVRGTAAAWARGRPRGRARLARSARPPAVDTARRRSAGNSRNPH